jgi:hypothetical protein
MSDSMKKFSLTILFTVAVIIARASFSIDWMKYPNMLANEGTSIARDDSDNVFTTTSTGDIFLEKRDRFGNLLWQQHSFTTIAFNYENPTQVHVDPQGNPVVVGYRHTISSDGHNANALIVLKYSAGGTILYKLIVDGSYSNFNNSHYWTKVSSQMDADGYLYIGTAGQVTGYPQQGFNVLKISPAGSIVRVSTKNFTTTTGFHFISQFRLDNNLMGVTGVTDYSSANATTWVLDTAGNDLWNAVTPGIQGKDISFDGSGNAFMLTWISPNFSGDVLLYKFDPAGNQLWSQTYDFGGSDLAARMEKTPDGNLAIMAYGTGGSNYVDWVTFKVDTAGNLLWSDRYDEHGNNDEIPYMMAVDNQNNIYVTGIGGPFPGGNNLGKRQMVTVKYAPAGTREWASAIDTVNEYLSGTGIAIAGDNSLFVLGDVNTFIVHYLDHTGTSACSTPTGVAANSITDSTALIGWAPVTNAYLYHVQFKTAASATWETISTNQTSCLLTSLFQGTLYDYKVEAICNSGPTGYSTAQQFTTGGTGYCTSHGLDATHEWIDLVFIESLLNSTPDTDSGYADYTYLSVDLLAGNSYDITLSAGMDIALHTESWKVWIDFNQDEDFTDAGEEVVSYTSSQIGWETNTIMVPSSALTGQTIMRVSMKDGSPVQTPCEVFSLGEVEDYTVNINSLTGIVANDAQTSLTVIPHGGNKFSVRANALSGHTYSLKVTDMLGKNISTRSGRIAKGIVLEELWLPELTSGIYMIVLETEKENIVHRIPSVF